MIPNLGQFKKKNKEVKSAICWGRKILRNRWRFQTSGRTSRQKIIWVHPPDIWHTVSALFLPQVIPCLVFVRYDCVEVCIKIEVQVGADAENYRRSLSLRINNKKELFLQESLYENILQQSRHFANYENNWNLAITYSKNGLQLNQRMQF